MTPQMTQELFREKITLVKKIVKEWNPPYSYVTKHDIEALLWGLDRQADLIRRLKEDNERLSQSFIEQNNICVHCGSVVCTEFGYYEQLHTDDCPITLHFILMEKLKQEGVE